MVKKEVKHWKMRTETRLKLLEQLIENGVEDVSRERGFWKVEFEHGGYALIDPWEGGIDQYVHKDGHSNDGTSIDMEEVHGREIDRRIRNLDTQFKRISGYYQRRR